MHTHVLTQPNYPHTAAFSEIANVLQHSLADLDLTNTLPDIQIIFGANAFPHHDDIKPDDIIFNCEQQNSGWFTAHYLQRLRAHRVLDFEAQRVTWLRNNAIDAYHLPLGYHDAWTIKKQPPLPDAGRDIDILFYGSPTSHRHPILQRLHMQFPKFHCVFSVYGEARDSLIRRARVVLNLHANHDNTFEIIRVAPLLASDVLVISECRQDEHLPYGVVGFPHSPGAVAAMLQTLLGVTPEVRAELAAQCAVAFRHTSMTDNLLATLHQMAILPVYATE